jgi:RND family efflux transporter MFP subunit
MTGHTPKWFITVGTVTALLLVILLALGMLGGESKIEPGNTTAIEPILPSGAQTLKVSKQTANNILSWQGVVRSRIEARIAPKLNARIVEITVYPGNKVKKGDIIARLDDRDLQAAYHATSAALTAAQAQATQANAEQKRFINLYDKQAVTRQNYEAVLAQAQVARAMANQAANAALQSKVMLNENVLYAPFNGVVGERLQEPGDMSLPNQAIVTLHKPEDLRFEAAIASHCVAPVKLGMEVKVRFDTFPQMLAATVDEITPEIDPQTRTQKIKVSLPKIEGLQQGQFGWLELGCTAEQQVILIPTAAIVYYGQLQAVKVVDGQRLITRHVRTGKRYGQHVEVLSGLHEGETIVGNGGLLQ